MNGSTDRVKTFGKRSSAVAVLVLVLVYLIPIWNHKYIPTQDGPVHLFNSVMLKNFNVEGMRYHEVFELNIQALPNWATHLFLIASMYFFPPLICEKLLVTCYVLAFVACFNYFATSYGAGRLWATAVSLVFVYNASFFFGFYNYCISVGLCFAIFAYFSRCQSPVRIPNGFALSILLLITYFTHLIGFLLAAAGLLWLSLWRTHKRHDAGVALMAMFPSALLTLNYLSNTDFIGEGGSTLFFTHLWRRFEPQAIWLETLTAIDRVFMPFVTSNTLLLILLAIQFQTMVVVCILLPTKSGSVQTPQRRLLPIVIFCFGLFLLYYAAPDFLGEHGGFLKMRVLLPATMCLLVIMMARSPRLMRHILTATAIVTACFNLKSVNDYCTSQNGVLSEFTAGVKQMGQNQIFLVVGNVANTSRTTGSPLMHAYGYYTLDNGNVALDNYQGVRSHFPVRFRPGVNRATGTISNYENSDLVDAIVAWDSTPQVTSSFPSRFQEVFHSERLQIFRTRP